MYLTEKEIFGQYEALEKTYNYFINKAEVIKGLKKNSKFDSITFIGSGSSYCLCQSGEISTKIHLGIPANSIPAGDLMLNFSHYENYIRNTLLVVLTRSGSTTEILLATKKAKEKFNVYCISICAFRKSKLSNIVNFSLEIPWAFDESICQTRTVTNLYLANMLLISIIADDLLMQEELKDAIKKGESLMLKYIDCLKKIADNRHWENVIILADSELQGIACEGELVFKEISQIPSNYYHILDVRHGPIVLINDKTLVILACSPYRISYQNDLINDLHKKKAKIVSVGSLPGKDMNSDLHIETPNYTRYGVSGIHFIFVPQIIAYFKAISKGINPDRPEGLDPWIKL